MKTFAKTFRLGGDLEVNRLGFGAMRIVGDGVWGEPKDVENSKRVLKRALESGVNFIDTSDAYGPALSERLIGEALAPYPQGAGDCHQGRADAARPWNMGAGGTA
jgi:pyridoxine 4-dehydrogenase